MTKIPKSIISIVLSSFLLLTVTAVSATPIIDIEKSTNGVDADDPASSPLIAPGDLVTFIYLVTNNSTADEVLQNIVVTDDNGTPGDTSDDFNPSFTGTDIGSDGLLSPDEMWQYEMSITAADLGINGLYSNIADVTASVVNSDVMLADSDPSHYRNPPVQAPEPTTLLLMGLGLAGIGFHRRRNFRGR